MKNTSSNPEPMSKNGHFCLTPKGALFTRSLSVLVSFVAFKLLRVRVRSGGQASCFAKGEQV